MLLKKARKRGTRRCNNLLLQFCLECNITAFDFSFHLAMAEVMMVTFAVMCVG
jgi:hypothetical protein